MSYKLSAMVDANSSFAELKAKCLSEKNFFEDDKFPATDDSLSEDLVEKLEGSGKLIWLRPKEIIKDAKLVHEKATKFDVKQGKLGNCWFLGSMANLPKYQSVFEFVLPPENKDFNDDDYCGIFNFRFWYYGQWVEVVIDDRLPTVDGKLSFVHSEHLNVFWSALLEKAYAKLHGSYKAIVGGWTAEAFEELTGGIGEYFNVKNETQKFFDYIQFCLENHCLVCCATVTGKDSMENRKITIGIPDKHAYSVTGTKKISNEILLLRIRNPWGTKTEWTGAWADGSSQWNTLRQEEIEELQLTFDPDGEYWMNWEDFIKYFQDVEIGYLNPFCFCYKDETENTPEEFSREYTCISGVWTAENLLGKESVKDNSLNLEKSLQYIMKINKAENDDDDKEYKIIICLMIKNRRLKSKHISKTDLTLYDFDKNVLSLSSKLNEAFFEGNEPIEPKRFGFNKSEEKICYFNLKAGDHAIILSSKVEAGFLLRICSTVDVQIHPLINKLDVENEIVF